MMMSNARTLQWDSEDAEMLYNEIVKLYLSDDYSDEMDKIIDKYQILYKSILARLRNNGIGAVRINGTFIDINWI